MRQTRNHGGSRFTCKKRALFRESLKNAINLAAPESYFRLFLDEDACISTLLGKLRNLAPDFIDILSDKYRLAIHYASGVTATAESDSIAGLAEPLSERELEVLRLVAEGLPNEEIADRLFISLGTTKWHITNIFSKLGVRNRVQAVEAAKSILPK